MIQRLSYMSCRTAVALAGFGMFDFAKLQLFSELDKKKDGMQQKKKPRRAAGLGAAIGVSLIILSQVSRSGLSG